MSKPKKPKLLNIAGFAIPADRWLKADKRIQKEAKKKKERKNNERRTKIY